MQGSDKGMSGGINCGRFFLDAITWEIKCQIKFTHLPEFLVMEIEDLLFFPALMMPLVRDQTEVTILIFMVRKKIL